MLFLQNGVEVELSIENKQPVQNIFSESLLADIATTDELRAMAGLPPLADVEGDTEAEEMIVREKELNGHIHG